jgi:glycerate dehydrogenase
MKLAKGIFLDKDSIHPQDLDLKALQYCLDEWCWKANTAAADVAEAIHDCEVVISNKVPLSAADLKQAPRLKLVCAAATGVNHIDVAAAKQLGIPVCNVRAYATPAVVQHVFALILTMVTSLDRYRRDVISGAWSKSEFFCLLDYPIREIQGMTLGIIGYGELGQAVAQVARAFGMNVLVARRDANDARPDRLPLDQLLPQVDVLSLHCPLNTQTEGMIAERELALMKPDAFLINTARGGLVNEAALLHALHGGRLAGAALDVIAREPPELNSPLINQMPANLIITPHTAWASRESRQRLVDQLVDVIQGYQSGRLINAV